MSFWSTGDDPQGMIGSYRKNPSASWIVNLQDFIRLLSTSEYLKKYFENDYKSQTEGKK